MATEVTELDQIICAVRELKRDNEWSAGIKRIAELAERVVELEEEKHNLRREMIDLQGRWADDEDAQVLNAARIMRDRLARDLARVTASREAWRSSCISATEEIVTLKQTIEDKEAKCAYLLEKAAHALKDGPKSVD